MILSKTFQGSRWTLQATLMNGRIDFLNWTMKPDQMQVLNPLLVLLFIPFFETGVYPLLAKIGIRKPLQKISLGGFLAALAFVLSAVVQNKIIVSIYLREIIISVVQPVFIQEGGHERSKNVLLKYQIFIKMLIHFDKFDSITLVQG